MTKIFDPFFTTKDVAAEPGWGSPSVMVFYLSTVAGWTCDEFGRGHDIHDHAARRQRLELTCLSASTIKWTKNVTRDY